jgi:quinol monooxygenase YgiN
MLTVEFLLVVKHDHLQNFLADVAPKALPATREWQGNEGLTLWQDRSDPRRISLRMNWSSLDDFDSYLAWRVETGFLGQLDAICDEPPVWHYWQEHVRL